LNQIPKALALALELEPELALERWTKPANLLVLEPERAPDEPPERAPGSWTVFVIRK
jgi:hypothetical protein